MLPKNDNPDLNRTERRAYHKVVNTNRPLDRLPEQVKKELTPINIIVFNMLHDMMRNQNKKSQGHNAYCFPGEKWIGKRVNRCPVTISKTISKLKTLGLLWVTYRRKVRGRWQTNLYRLGHELIKAFGFTKPALNQLLNRLALTLNRVSKDKYSNKKNKETEFINHKKPDEELEQILKRCQDIQPADYKNKEVYQNKTPGGAYA